MVEKISAPQRELSMTASTRDRTPPPDIARLNRIPEPQQR
jgi:hypothetical protein